MHYIRTTVSRTVNPSSTTCNCYFCMIVQSHLLSGLLTCLVYRNMRTILENWDSWIKHMWPTWKFIGHLFLLYWWFGHIISISLSTRSSSNTSTQSSLSLPVHKLANHVCSVHPENNNIMSST